MQAKYGKKQMKREKREEIGVWINNMLGKIRDDFRNIPWPKNLTKDRIGKLLK
jgi:hypothetical protein